jgi:steroid 5-alpha reductase family enzyme
MIEKVIGIFLIAGIMVALSYALGLQSRYVLGAPLIWLLNAYCFAVQIIIFIPSALFKT